MGIRAGALSSSFGFGAALLAAACSSHLTKLPVTEIPIDQFEGTPVATAPADVPSAVPVVEPEPPPSAATTTPSAPVVAAPASHGPVAPPASVDPSQTPEENVDAAIKLMKTGKRADVVAARKLLYNDVASGSCTQGEARMLRTVCLKLNDKPCVAKAVSAIK